MAIEIKYDHELKMGVVSGSRDKAEILAAARAQGAVDEQILWPDGELDAAQAEAADILDSHSEDSSDTPHTPEEIFRLAWALMQRVPCNSAKIFERKYDELVARGMLKFAE